MIHPPLMVALEVSPTMLSEILVLIVSFTLPVINTERTKDIGNSSGCLNTSTVRNQEVHCSPFADNIFQCIDKFFGVSNTIDVNDKRLTTNKYLRHGLTVGAPFAALPS